MKNKTRRRNKRQYRRKIKSRRYHGGQPVDKDELITKMLIGLSEKIREKISMIAGLKIAAVRNWANSFLDRIRNENIVLFSALENTSEDKIKDMSKEERLNFIKMVYDAWITKNPTHIIYLLQSSTNPFYPEIPDIIKFFSNYWVLQYLVKDDWEHQPLSGKYPISQYLWGEAQAYALAQQKELETLRTGVIESYVKWENTSGDNWKNFWISNKLWNSWPSKDPWQEFLAKYNISASGLRCPNLLHGYKCEDPPDESASPTLSSASEPLSSAPTAASTAAAADTAADTALDLANAAKGFTSRGRDVSDLDDPRELVSNPDAPPADAQRLLENAADVVEQPKKSSRSWRSYLPAHGARFPRPFKTRKARQPAQSPSPALLSPTPLPSSPKDNAYPIGYDDFASLGSNVIWGGRSRRKKRTNRHKRKRTRYRKR